MNRPPETFKIIVELVDKTSKTRSSSSNLLDYKDKSKDISDKMKDASDDKAKRRSIIGRSGAVGIAYLGNQALDWISEQNTIEGNSYKQARIQRGKNLSNKAGIIAIGFSINPVVGAIALAGNALQLAKEAHFNIQKLNVKARENAIETQRLVSYVSGRSRDRS